MCGTLTAYRYGHDAPKSVTPGGFMNWEGEIRWSAGVGGRVKVGDHYVPSKVTMSGLGSGGSPDLSFEFAMSSEGEARCVSAHVDAKPDGRGVATADLAMIAVDQLTVAAFERLAQEILYNDERGIGTAYSGGTANSTPIRRAVDKGKQSKAGEIATVAKVYAEADRAPMKAVEDRLGYTRRTAARRIELARERGLLPEKGEAFTDAHRQAIERALAEPDDGTPDSFATPAEFEAAWAKATAERAARKAASDD